MRNITQTIKMLILLTGVMVCCLISHSAAADYTLATPHFTVDISRTPFAVTVSEKSGKEILSHAAGAWVLQGDQKLFLKDCAEKQVQKGIRVALECNIGNGTVTAAVAVENDYEFSLTLTADKGLGHSKLGHAFALPREQSIYGIKEHVEGDGKSGTDMGAVQSYATLDQRGATVEMYTRPTISIYSPFHINSRGYGLFFDTTWPGVYDLGDSDPLVADIGFEGSQLPMIFTWGPDMGGIIERHTDRVGKTLLPPKWAAEVFKWRDDHYNIKVLFNNSVNPTPFNSQVYEDVMMLEKLGIPTGVYWLDRPWATGPFGYDDFEFDTNRFPEPEKMIKWLKEKYGMEMLLWVAPWAYGKMRDVAEEKGYLAPNSDKVIDFTNPDAVEWWKKEFHKMFDLGVAGFKLDRCEEVIPSSLDDVYHDGRTGRELHNLYPMLYARTVQEACQMFRGDDCLVMPRSGFTGSQKYAVFWGGDTHPSWRGLRSAVISALRANLMGFPVWGSDTGGYGVSETQDLFSRWMQVSAFHPIMEIGGSGSHEPWAAGYEPKYDEIGINNYRFYAKLHTELLPYNYSNMYHAHKTGRPILRPLVYHWPGDPRVRDMWDEFMFGPWILVAPVLTQDARSREVYLPDGTWYDFWYYRNVMDGGKNYLVDAPIEKIPIFIRGGAIIPLNILDMETGWGTEFTSGILTIAMFPAKNETQFTYYDGETAAEITIQDRGEQVVMDTSALKAPALLRVKTDKPKTVSVDGQQLDRFKKIHEFAAADAGWYWVPKEQLLWIKTPSGGKFTMEKLF